MDVRAGHFDKYEVRYVTDSEKWRSITGQQATYQPAFYMQGQGDRPQILGYVDAPGLIQVLLKIVVGIGKSIYNKRHHDPEIGSIAEPRPVPEPPAKDDSPRPYVREEPSPPPKEAELDWSHASIIFLIPEKIDAGDFKSAVIATAEELASGIASRKLNEMTDGKVLPQWVFGRTTPERYKAVSKAVEADSGVFVLVARQDAGFIKGLAVKRIEAQLPDKLKKLPVEIIFERTHPELFAKISTALKTEEPQPEPVPGEPRKTVSVTEAIFSDPKTYLLGLAAERLQDRLAAWWRKRKSKQIQTEVVA